MGGSTLQDWVVTVTTVVSEVALALDSDRDHIGIFPTPSSSGCFNLKLPPGLDHEDIDIKVYDLAGKRARFKTIGDGQNVSIILNEPNGAYTLYLKTEDRYQVASKAITYLIRCNHYSDGHT